MTSVYQWYPTIIVLLLCLSFSFAYTDPTINEDDRIFSRPSVKELSDLAKKRAQLLGNVKSHMSVTLSLLTGDATSVIDSSRKPLTANLKYAKSAHGYVSLGPSSEYPNERFNLTFNPHSKNNNKYSLRQILSLLSNEVVDPRNKLFTSNEAERKYNSLNRNLPLSNYTVINRFPHRLSHMAFIEPRMHMECLPNSRCDKYFQAIGRVIGIAILNQQFLDLTFTSMIYKFILGRTNDIGMKDLKQVDLDLFNHLLQVSTDHNYVLEKNLFMTYTEYSLKGSIDLIDNGSQVLVTDENKSTYIELTIKAFVKYHIEPSMYALNTGLFEIIPRHILQHFNEKELNVLISGNTRLEVNDWRSHSPCLQKLYGDMYTDMIFLQPSLSEQIKWFWDLVDKLDMDMKRKLMLYVTGTSRLPISGFKAWHSKWSPQGWFNINYRVKANDKRVNSSPIHGDLWLPKYKSMSALKDALEMMLKLKGSISTWYYIDSDQDRLKQVHKLLAC